MTESALQELRYRAHIHHRDRGALLAVRSGEGEGVGVARYMRHPSDAESAEVDIAVLDEWGEAGLADELLSRLAEHARGQGLRRFRAVLPVDDGGATRAITLVRTSDESLACEVPLPRRSSS